MARVSALLYGLIAYVLFLGVFLYAIGFVGGFAVPKTIDGPVDGAPADFGVALAIDLALLGAFGLQHSIMARPAFKRWWTRLVPRPIERATFVLASNAVLALLYWQWRPLPDVVWQVDAAPLRMLLHALFAAGFLVVLLSSFLIDHFDLFGLRQVVAYARGVPYEAPVFRARSLYAVVRHPLMLGFVVAFWATPRMTQGHLLFAVVTTLYILVAIRIEERDLMREHGASYGAYRGRVPMLLPLPAGRRGRDPAARGRP